MAYFVMDRLKEYNDEQKLSLLSNEHSRTNFLYRRKNREYKKVRVDLSYILMCFGEAPLKGIDKKINPSKELIEKMKGVPFIEIKQKITFLNINKIKDHLQKSIEFKENSSIDGRNVEEVKKSKKIDVECTLSEKIIEFVEDPKEPVRNKFSRAGADVLLQRLKENNLRVVSGMLKESVNENFIVRKDFYSEFPKLSKTILTKKPHNQEDAEEPLKIKIPEEVRKGYREALGYSEGEELKRAKKFLISLKQRPTEKIYALRKFKAKELKENNEKRNKCIQILKKETKKATPSDPEVLEEKAKDLKEEWVDVKGGRKNLSRDEILEGLNFIKLKLENKFSALVQLEKEIDEFSESSGSEYATETFIDFHKYNKYSKEFGVKSLEELDKEINSEERVLVAPKQNNMKHKSSKKKRSLLRVKNSNEVDEEGDGSDEVKEIFKMEGMLREDVVFKSDGSRSKAQPVKRSKRVCKKMSSEKDKRLRKNIFMKVFSRISKEFGYNPSKLSRISQPTQKMKKGLEKILKIKERDIYKMYSVYAMKLKEGMEKSGYEILQGGEMIEFKEAGLANSLKEEIGVEMIRNYERNCKRAIIYEI